MSRPARADSAERLNLALESARMGVWAWDAVEQESFWDERTCEIFGRPYRNGLGASADEVLAMIHPEDRRELESRFAVAVQRRLREVAGEYRVIWPDGSVHHVSMIGSAFYDATGRLSRSVGVVQDVTGQRTPGEQVRQTQKLECIGRLAGGIAHDFNNLLTVINGYSELLLREFGQMAPVRSKVLQIKRAGEQAAKLTNQLLAVGRKQVMNLQPLDINVLIQDLLPMLRRAMEGVKLKLVLEPGLGLALADSGQVSQVVLNLAMNAYEAMPVGGLFTLQTANFQVGTAGKPASDLPIGDYVLLTLSDTGTGMDAETQKRIFEPFFTTKKAVHGAGLGLATVYGIVAQTGGRIECHSEPGAGTVFRIYLPAAGVQQTAAQLLLQRPLDGGSRQGVVLVADDEPGFRSLVRDVLEAFGYQVLEAADGKQALAAKERHRIDILITDLAMPDMDGIELIRAFLHTAQSPSVVAISGAFDASVLKAARLLGAKATLTKPIDTDALVTLVKGLVRS
ncbi:MAG TPA: response regulator [Bryobacteraceae bacterium]|nr:response regulator [Bryobacteraceae bacterium]